MVIQQDIDVYAFAAAAGPLLYAQEATYSLILGLVEGLQQKMIHPEMPPIFLRLEEAGQTEAAFVQLRPSSSAVTRLDASGARLLAQYLAQTAGIPEQQSFVGARPGCSLLASGYAALKKKKTKTLMGQKILRAHEVIPPRAAPGKMRLATEDDQALTYEFITAFHRECIPHDPFVPERMRKWNAERIANSQIYLWTVEGRVLAMAHSSRPTQSTITINAVYTPPAARGHGYASNLMAQLTRFLLDTGKRECVLYTDAANPTSNKIYESVGYQVVAESEHIGLT